MARIELLSGIERRRRWSAEEKRRLVSAAFAPGAVVSEVARRMDVHANQLYRWRQELRRLSGGFAEVVVSSDFPQSCPAASLSDGAAPVIEIAFADRAQLRLPVSVSSDLAAAVIGALMGRPVFRGQGQER